MHLGKNLIRDLAELPRCGIPDPAMRTVDTERPFEACLCYFLGCCPKVVLRHLAGPLAIPFQADRLAAMVLSDDGKRASPPIEGKCPSMSFSPSLSSWQKVEPQGAPSFSLD
jgi:hypothetical protein